jgi:hypothetical protein
MQKKPDAPETHVSLRESCCWAMNCPLFSQGGATQKGDVLLLGLNQRWWHRGNG